MVLLHYLVKGMRALPSLAPARRGESELGKERERAGRKDGKKEGRGRKWEWDGEV